MKWELVKDNIEQNLKKNDSSIEIALETNQEIIDLKRELFQHQEQKFSFLYSQIRIKNIKNPILGDRLYNHIEKISNGLFPHNVFQVENLLCSHLKFRGIKIEDIRTNFIKKNLLLNLVYKKYSYDELSGGLFKDLLDLVRQAFIDFKNSHHNIVPRHGYILKEIMLKHRNAMASEVPILKKIHNEFIVGNIDLILANNYTIYIADLKDNETDMLKSLPQIMSYGVLSKKLFFKNESDFNYCDLKLIVFSRNEIWEFQIDSLKQKIVEFIEYANSIRDNRLMTISDPRRDLQKEIEKVVAFLRIF